LCLNLLHWIFLFLFFKEIIQKNECINCFWAYTYCWITERNTIWQYKFAKICTLSCTLCPLYRPEQGNIVGRKYIKVCKFVQIYFAIWYISRRFNNMLYHPDYRYPPFRIGRGYNVVDELGINLFLSFVIASSWKCSFRLNWCKRNCFHSFEQFFQKSLHFPCHCDLKKMWSSWAFEACCKIAWQGKCGLIRTYAEEREWVYNFANASMMTENGTFLWHKITPPWKLFFFRKKQCFFILQL
jgi:hypothetical protein